MLKTLEFILNNSEKMAYYNQNIFLKATLLALYEYKKKGLSLNDLGWFTPATSETIKKAA